MPRGEREYTLRQVSQFGKGVRTDSTCHPAGCWSCIRMLLRRLWSMKLWVDDKCVFARRGRFTTKVGAPQ